MTVDQSLFKRLPERRAYQEIVEQISDLIFSKKVNTGDRLPSERELSIQFGAGRMAVREAFRVLEQTGLIIIKQGAMGGAYVKEVDFSTVSDSMCNLIRRANVKLEDFIAVRSGVDRLIIEIVIDASTHDLLSKLENNLIGTKIAMKNRDSKGPSILIPESAHFHIELARGTNNLLFEILEESLLKTMRAFMREGSYSYEFDENHLAIHKSLYEAIKKKDLSYALRCIEDHSLNMLEYLRSYTQ